MWGAESLASGSGNLWLLLATIVSTFGAIASTVITVWRPRSGPTRDEISLAVEDAIDEYRETFTEPLREENRALRDELADKRRQT